jgi:hypothetical protein
MKIGDLVKIVHNVHDENMTKSKTGMIVEFVGKQEDQVMVMFGNFKTLKFHVSQVAQIVSRI